MNIEKLKEVCLADDSWFASLGGTSYTQDGILHFLQRGGGEVLGVAYIGTQPDGHRFFSHNKKLGQAWGATLWQRLGAHILLNELPNIGILTDVLIVGDTKDGIPATDAFFFTEPYNWVYSFDLNRSGVYMGQYETDLLQEQLVEYGLVTRSVGPEYSAIDDLWFLGCAGFNFGNGVLGDGPLASCLTRITRRQVGKFSAFFRDFSDTALEYDAAADDNEGDPESNDAFDFSAYANGRDVCDLCSNFFDASELTFIRSIGDGVYLCNNCINAANLQELV